MKILNKRGSFSDGMENKSSCKKYDLETILLYIENKLEGDELAKFEKHLTVCQSCLETVQNAIKDTALMEKIEPVKVPKKLLEMIRKNKELVNKILIVKLLQAGFEYINGNIKNYKIKSIKYRDDEQNEKKRFELTDDTINLQLIPIEKDKFDIELLVDEYFIGKPIELFLKVGKQIRLIIKQKITEKKTYLSNFEKGNYLLKIDELKYNLEVK